MRKRKLLTSLAVTLIILSGSFSVLAHDEDSSFTVFYPSRDFRDSPEAAAQAKHSGFSDYQDVVIGAANKNSRALNRLFQIDAKTEWDAAGGEQQNSTMRQMLLIWGDFDFAQALVREPVDVQKAVTANFRIQPHDKSFAILFPRTAAIGKRVWRE